MTPLDRIKARLNAPQVAKLADMLDAICSEDGSFTVAFRARKGRHHPVVVATFAKDEEVGWPQPNGQADLPLDCKGSPLTRST